MEIKIENGTPVGVIKAKRILLKDPKKYVYYPEKPLYDFCFAIWEDFETNIVLIKMWGSIVSMMQYRKYLLMNRPQLKRYLEILDKVKKEIK